MPKKVQKKYQKSDKKRDKKSDKKEPKKVPKNGPKKGPKNVSIFETFLVPQTRQKGYTLLTRFDVGVTTTNSKMESWIFSEAIPDVAKISESTSDKSSKMSGIGDCFGENA